MRARSHIARQHHEPLWKRWVRHLGAAAGYAFVNARDHYAEDGLFTLHRHAFSADPLFRAAYARGVAASDGVDPHFEWRVHVALWAAQAALRVPGDFVECGVNAGFLSSAILHATDWATRGRQFYLVDTFAGPVLSQFSAEEQAAGRAAIARDALARGAYVTDIDRLQRNFSEWPNVHLVPGVAPDVLPRIPSGRVAFLHLDLNCAYPERAALEFFWDRLSLGALVLLDDYAYLGHDAQGDAIDNFLRGLDRSVLALPTGQGLIVR